MTDSNRPDEAEATLRSSPRPPSFPHDQCTIALAPDALDFETTAEIPILESVIEQDRAMKSLDIGLAIERPNFHVYIAGASGTGKRSQLKMLLKRIAPTRPTPPDWIYVHNFEDVDAPIAISLKHGKGNRFKKDIEDLLEQLTEELPKTYHSRENQERIQHAIYVGNTRNNEAFLKLRRAAAEMEFEVRSNDEGELLTLPIIDNQVIDDKMLLSLSDEIRQEVEKRRELLEPLFTDFLQSNRIIDRETATEIKKITRKLTESVARKPFQRLRRKYAPKNEQLKDFLKDLQKDFVEQPQRYVPDDDQPSSQNPGRDPLAPFQVRVVVDHSKTRGAPVVFETHPTFYRVFGKIERKVEQGIYFTDHTMIRGGSLLRANGGYLVCHAEDLFSLPGVWDNLKTTLRNREVAIEDMGETAGLLPTSGLKPDPIPIAVKLILIGSNTVYHAVYRADRDFQKIFQIKADFDDEIRRNALTEKEYVRFVATTAKTNNCRPLSRDAVAAVIEHGSRLVESQRKLTLRFNAISNVLVEAEYYAKLEKSKLIHEKHIWTAIEERQARSSLIADKMHEDLLDDQVLLESKDSKIGVINGLAVLSVGEHEFGRPFRITARCFAGQAGIVNIEHEVHMSGELHDKGVQILAGFLGHRFAHDRPLAMTATVTFEQSYGSVNGDSASSAWLVAILSALAEVPIDQGIGLTGSVNQLGEIQPIGGVNQKIEGFYRFCEARGLTGTQGVIIPWQNTQHLMLSAPVRASIAEGLFHVWPVRTIDEAVARATCVEAGELNEERLYPPCTVMYRVQRRLDELRHYHEEHDSAPKDQK